MTFCRLTLLINAEPFKKGTSDTLAPAQVDKVK